jgi:uncharacterized protein YecE (DUF72 family)
LTTLDRPLRLGTAGWSIPFACRDRFDGAGALLERYARELNAVEINTSFYKPHRRQTYEKWASLTPDNLRFAVKVPKTITHEDTLDKTVVERFLGEINGLGRKLAVLLVQFAPSKTFEQKAAGAIFEALRQNTSVALVCEPQHASWFTNQVEKWLADFRIARVAADPLRAEGGDEPGGWRGITYMRLHGSPRIYYSAYHSHFLQNLENRLRVLRTQSDVWCIFDNTASGAALPNAFELRDRF